MKERSFDRVFLLVMDSVGIGAMPDAAQFGDEGANTLGNISKHMNGLALPNLHKLGLGHIEGVEQLEQLEEPISLYGRMQEVSVGKDTMTGHWELMGLHIKVPFQTYTETGFPEQLIEAFEEKIGRKTLGNKAASGTEIIAELGEEHLRTGSPIVYTSSDSVFQIAAHEEIIPPEELYQMCHIARELTLREPYVLGRVIARPFIGEAPPFQRTANRRDYALKPFSPTVMNALEEAGYDSIAIGKISDIYDGEGITKAVKTVSNMDGMDRWLESMKAEFKGLSFVNLVDFDALYGHRRDPLGYGRALEEFDRRLAEVFPLLQQRDVLIITADHGNDPTHHGSDHTREYVPLLVYSPAFKAGGSLGTRATFADVGATIADIFKVQAPLLGSSFLAEMKDLLN